jgi:glycosyltransferase involved in cell wall biosynthesis
MYMISIVIPAFNEEKAILPCLDAMCRQTFTHPFEVILVDNGSTDNTCTLAHGYADKIQLRILTEKKKGRGAARTRGFSEARGEIILSTDADSVVPANWIELVVQNLTASGAAALTGACRMEDCPEPAKTLVNTFQPVTIHAYRLLYGHYWLNGFNFGIQKSAYMKSGGFDPGLNALEDIDLSFRVAKTGRIILDNRICVTCSGRRFAGGVLPAAMSYFSSFYQYRHNQKAALHMTDVR